MSLTPEGELYLEHARRILGEIDDMEELLGQCRSRAAGAAARQRDAGFRPQPRRAADLALRAQAIRRCEVQLQLSVDPPPLTDDAFDVCVRFGAPPDARVIARQHRAEPPAAVRVARLSGQARHAARCRTTWRGTTASASARATRPTASGGCPSGRGKRTDEAVKVRGQPDHQRRRDRGQLGARRPRHPDARRVGHRALPAQRAAGAGAAAVLQTPDADIHAVYPQRHQVSARVRAFVDFVEQHFAKSSTRAAGLVGGW